MSRAMHHPHPAPRSAGFTLVELLIVIAIIAVLVSILLPAVHRARDAGRSIQCASNMAETYKGMMLFAHDYQGRFPRYAQRSSTADPEIAWAIMVSLHSKSLLVAIFGNNDSGLGQYNFYYTLEPKFRNRRYLSCSEQFNNTSQGTLRYWNMSYAAAGGQMVSGFGRGLRGVEVPNAASHNSGFPNAYVRMWLGSKVSSFRNASDKILIVESEGGRSYWRPSGGNASTTGILTQAQFNQPARPYTAVNGLYAFRHSKMQRMNLLMVDGHVESRSRTDELNAWRLYNVDGSNSAEPFVPAEP